jgi:16S rRNA G966 N2-methylase RsmD
MRIISGALKGRTFRVPPGFPSRPTTDFAKEGLFNILENNYDFNEFLSRGASSITAVDKNGRVCSFLHKNAQELQLAAKLTVVNTDCLHFLERTVESFDIIIADPPFDLPIHNTISETVFHRNLLKPDGILIIEHGKRTVMDNATNFNKTRNFGNVNFSFFTWP